MSLYLKIILGIFALAYFISPVDIIPDLLLPYIGWLDDATVIWIVVYLIRYGRLPNFIFKNRQPFNNPAGQRPASNVNAWANSNNGTPNSKTQPEPEPDNEQFTDLTPWEILGLKPGASKEKIQQAYKEAVKKYHPDKLSHLGEEFSRLANQKFLAIQKAYDTLMKNV